MKKTFIQTLCISAIVLVFAISNVSAYSAYGSSGEEVKALQNKLTELGFYSYRCDGVFGTSTRDAVAAYQKANNLLADGIAGKKTLAHLKIIDNSEVELLARVINGEARGESFIGQVAVGAVVLNRVEHPGFPNNIYDVVYQKNAFTAVNDGQIKYKVTESCRRAAMAALAGEDPTNGAVYYYNPKTATSKWIKTRKVVKTIGNHLFCV